MFIAGICHAMDKSLVIYKRCASEIPNVTTVITWNDFTNARRLSGYCEVCYLSLENHVFNKSPLPKKQRNFEKKSQSGEQSDLVSCYSREKTMG